MILSAIIIMFVGMITGLISFLPDMTILPDSIENAWNYLAGFTANMLYVIPGGTIIMTAIYIIILLEVSIFLWNQTKMVINWIRGSGA